MIKLLTGVIEQRRNIYEGVTVSKFLVICSATLFQTLLLAPVFPLFLCGIFIQLMRPDDNRAETYRSWKVTPVQL